MVEFGVDLLPCSKDGVAVLRPVGSIDAATAPVLESHFKSLHEQNIHSIVVDFSRVEFISSAGIGIFLGSVTLLRESNGDIIFLNVPPHVDEVFDIINLKSFFKTVDNVDQLEGTVQP